MTTWGEPRRKEKKKGQDEKEEQEKGQDKEEEEGQDEDEEEGETAQRRGKQQGRRCGAGGSVRHPDSTVGWECCP